MIVRWDRGKMIRLVRDGFLRRFVLCALLMLLPIQQLAAALPSEKSRGIPPEDLKYFQSNPIWCKDKSKSFPLARLNDDYCDCPDGTDEPGTAACPEGKFYCKNVGHAPQVLFSSRVNDGICDCCDGSDEYDGKITCTNTCWETGKKSREKLEKKVSVFKEGARLRAKDIQYSKQLRKQQESELVSLKKEEKGLKEITQKLKVQLDAVEEAERLEREKKAKEEEERRLKEEGIKNETLAAEAAAKKEGEEVDSTETQAQEHSDQKATTRVPEKTDEVLEASQTVDEVSGAPETYQEGKPEHVDEQEQPDTEGLSKEELGRLVASRWTGETAETGTPAEEEDADEDDKEDYHESYKDAHKDEDYQEEDDDSGDSFAYDTHTQTSPDVSDESEDVSWWQKLRQAPRLMFKLLGLRRMHVDVSEADRIRSDYRQSNSKLNDLHSKISDLENRLKQDFGKEGEFYSLYEQCFERRQQKYVYKVCLYKHATQEEGHSSTRLGNWEGFQDDYRAIKFQNGDHCWNGPERTLKLKLRCGLKSELSDIEEPSRCEYAASLWTPAVCYEERAKELQTQLDAMRAGLASDHQEL